MRDVCYDTYCECKTCPLRDTVTDQVSPGKQNKTKLRLTSHRISSNFNVISS